MAHVEHYTKTNIKNVLREHNRELHTYKNDVDASRSHLNWSIGINDATECYKAILSRVEAIMNGREPQPQTNLMSEWIITYPAELCEEVTGANGRTYNKPKNDDDCRQFFEEVYAFNCERYGKDNVIAGYVHMDETTPHISLQIVPEAESRKTGKRTVSSASLFNKKELFSYHNDLDDHLSPKFKGLVKNGRTKGDYTVREMKEREEQEKKLAEREKANEERERDNTERERVNAERERANEERERANAEKERENQEIAENLEKVGKIINEMVEKNISTVRIQTWMRNTICSLPSDNSFKTIQERYDDYCHKNGTLKDRLMDDVKSLASRSTERERSGSGIERQ